MISYIEFSELTAYAEERPNYVGGRSSPDFGIQPSHNYSRSVYSGSPPVIREEDGRRAYDDERESPIGKQRLEDRP